MAINPRKKSVLCAVDYNTPPSPSLGRKARSRLRAGGHSGGERERSRLENVIRRLLVVEGCKGRLRLIFEAVNCWKLFRVCGCHGDGRWWRGQRGRGGNAEIADRRGYYPRLAETFRAARIIAARSFVKTGAERGRFRCERDRLLVSRPTPRNDGMEGEGELELLLDGSIVFRFREMELHLGKLS